MLPSFRHRLLIALGLFVGGLAWSLALPGLLPLDGTAGVSLVTAKTNIVVAVLLLLVAGLPALALSNAAAAAGNPIAGMFSLSGALAVVAARGGGTDMWIRRFGMPKAYGYLIAESVIWLAMLAGAMVLMNLLRETIRPRLGRIANDEHLGDEGVLGMPNMNDVISGVVCGLVGGVLAYFLLRSADGGQLLGGLLLAFVIASTKVHMIMRPRSVVPMLLSPLLVAVVGYVWVLMRFGSEQAILEAWYLESTAGVPLLERFPSIALALPIHYASAGVAGVAMGVGLAQALNHAREMSAAEEHAKEARSAVAKAARSG